MLVRVYFLKVLVWKKWKWHKGMKWIKIKIHCRRSKFYISLRGYHSSTENWELVISPFCVCLASYLIDSLGVADHRHVGVVVRHLVYTSHQAPIYVPSDGSVVPVWGHHKFREGGDNQRITLFVKYREGSSRYSVSYIFCLGSPSLMQVEMVLTTLTLICFKRLDNHFKKNHFKGYSKCVIFLNVDNES